MKSVTAFWGLLSKELYLFRYSFVERTMNSLFWASTVLFSAFFFPQTGGAAGVPVYMYLLPAMIIAWGLFDVIGNSVALVADLTGHFTLSYELSLPLHQWLIFIKIACANAYRSVMSSLLIFPYGAAVIYLVKGKTYSNVCWYKAGIVFVLAHCLYAFLSLLVSVFMRDPGQVRTVWIRLIFPLWFLGGFYQTWSMFNSMSPLVGKILYFNPLLLLAEAMRAAMLGQQGYLPYWTCVGVVTVVTFIVGYCAVTQFLKRLDCVG